MISHWLHCTYSTLDFSTLHEWGGLRALGEMSVVSCIFVCSSLPYWTDFSRAQQGKSANLFGFWLFLTSQLTQEEWLHSKSADVSAVAAVQTDGCDGQQVASCGRQLSKCHSDALLSSAVFCWVIMYITLAIGYCINSEKTANRKATCSSQPTTNLTMSFRCSRDACTRGHQN